MECCYKTIGGCPDVSGNVAISLFIAEIICMEVVLKGGGGSWKQGEGSEDKRKEIGGRKEKERRRRMRKG